MQPHVVAVVYHLHFKVFIYLLRLFFVLLTQHFLTFFYLSTPFRYA